jgi:hypothetical protein
MTEETHRKWDIAFKIIAGIATVVTFYLTKQKEIDYDVWHRKSDIYANISLLATKVATASDERTDKAARSEFQNYYRGLFQMIAEPNSDASKSVSAFNDLLGSDSPQSHEALYNSAKKLAEIPAKK